MATIPWHKRLDLPAIVTKLATTIMNPSHIPPGKRLNFQIQRTVSLGYSQPVMR